MSDKKRRTLIIVLCVLAVVVAVAAIIVAPFGRKATGETDSPAITQNAQSTTENTAVSTNTTSEEISEEVSFSVPPSTEPNINPNKNYTLFIDKSTFSFTENEDGTMELVAKDNSNVKMTITPIRDESYKQRCNKAEDNHSKLSNSENLEIENTNSAYRSQTGDKGSDIITTVYCVDDNKGGCIEIMYQTPVSATEYAETIEIMLSMFKVI